jgi:hypothetical protein
LSAQNLGELQHQLYLSEGLSGISDVPGQPLRTTSRIERWLKRIEGGAVVDTSTAAVDTTGGNREPTSSTSSTWGTILAKHRPFLPFLPFLPPSSFDSVSPSLHPSISKHICLLTSTTTPVQLLITQYSLSIRPAWRVRSKPDISVGVVFVDMAFALLSHAVAGIV